MSEETIEELQAELDRLKKLNLEREIAAENAKIQESDKLKKDKEAEDLRKKIEEEVRAELLEETTGTSTVQTGHEETVGNEPKYKPVLESIKKKYNLKGTPYEEFAREHATGGNFKGERK